MGDGTSGEDGRRGDGTMKKIYGEEKNGKRKGKKEFNESKKVEKGGEEKRTNNLKNEMYREEGDQKRGT